RRPEPVWMVCLAVAGGVAAFFAADRIEARLLPFGISLEPSLVERARLAFLIAGPVEELVKFAAVLILIWPWTHFDETLDGIVYAAAAGAGFALWENFAFMKVEGPHVILARGPIGTGAHVLFAVLWGGALGFSGHLKGWLPRIWHVGVGLVLASLAHGTFNFITFSVGQEITVWQARAYQVGLLAVCAFFLRWRIRHALTLHPFRYRAGADAGEVRSSR
ncbi:MAG: PrsW family intramembrane metalloprotease, partial [Armatimonadetes bacterium]|nr:PrsW family intramembrane metalloprotease [Armatimonadota bacterium]